MILAGPAKVKAPPSRTRLAGDGPGRERDTM